MEREKYLTIQTQLTTLADFALLFEDEDLKQFIEKGQHSITVASIIDPTLVMMAGKKLQGIMGLAKAARKFRHDVELCRDTIKQGERTAQAYRDAGVTR